MDNRYIVEHCEIAFDDVDGLDTQNLGIHDGLAFDAFESFAGFIGEHKIDIYHFVQRWQVAMNHSVEQTLFSLLEYFLV